MTTIYTFSKRTLPQTINGKTYPSHDVKVEIKNVEELALGDLLDYTADFIRGCGYYAAGPLVFPFVEEERTMRILKEKEK